MHRNFKICSFNALHHYPAEKECQHMAECKNRIAFVDSKCLGSKLHKFEFMKYLLI
jgi:hypothetical protein